MTNVRKLRPATNSQSSSAAMVGERAADSSEGASLRAWQFLKTITVLLTLVGPVSPLIAQTPPDGSAPVSDVNRQALGFSVRGGHVAGDTVGRDDSVSLFNLSPYVNIGNGLLFGDARLVYGNEGGLAYSFGGGYRHYVPAWDAVVGGNIFADYDSLSGTHFQSWGAGGEILAHGWEARANVYNPYGTKSVQTGARADSNSAIFVGNNVEFSRIDSFTEALHGFDAEIGWLLPGKFSEKHDIRAFGGGYYYKGEGVPNFSGFSARLQTDIADHLELGLKLTDDEVFHTTVAFSAIVHFGGFSSQEHTSRSGMQRMAEPVRRNLNIAAVSTDITVPGQVAQAADSTNLTIVHVNSNAAPGGIGTVDRPFDMLSTGLGFNHPDVVDVVFVHAGSQFADMANNNATLDPAQSLFGEGLIRVQTIDSAGTIDFVRNRRVVNAVDLPGIGPLILPDSPTFATNLPVFTAQPIGTALTPGVTRPILSGATGNALTLNTDSRTAGLILRNASNNGIVISGTGGANIRDMLVENAFGSGLSIVNTPRDSTTTIINTEINNSAGLAPAFSIVGGGGNIIFGSDGLANDPPLGQINNTSAGAPVVNISGRIGGVVDMSGSSITDVGGSGIILANNSNTSMEAASLRVIVDNISLDSSTATGISISNNPGTVSGTEEYIFLNSSNPLNTSQTAIAPFHIQSATGSSIAISNVPDGSRVIFRDVFNIQTPLNTGVEISNLGGRVSFNQALTIGSPGVGAVAAPAFIVSNSQATGVVQLNRNVDIGGRAPAGRFTRGVDLNMNAAGSQFIVNGDTTIGTTSADGIAITTNDGTVRFGRAVTINDRAGTGINIFDSTGDITFGTSEEMTTINNVAATPSDLSGLIVNQSEAFVHFEHLNVQDAQINPAVNLTNNIPGVTGRTLGTALLSFDNMTIASAAAVPSPGLVGNMNEWIIVRNLPSALNVVANSTIFALDAPAVDLTDSGIDITFERIDSQNSPTFGIGLVRTNQPPTATGRIRKRFSVVGGLNNGLGSGGFILGAGTPAGSNPLTSAGVFLQNAGQVQLHHMQLDANNHGILVQNSGLQIDEDQFLELNNIQVTDSLRHGIRATNLQRLVITENSLFLDNGLAPRVAGDALRETLLLDYTENPLTTAVPPIATTLFDEFDNPYEVLIFGNDALNVAAFDTERDDAIRILNSGNGVGAHIDVLVDDTGFRIGDAFDLFAGESETAFSFTWDGVANVDILDNVVVLDGVNRMIAPSTDPGSQDAFQITVSSRTDELLTAISRNRVTSTIQDNSTAVRLTSAGPVTATISGNAFEFNGEDSIGARFRMSRNDENRFVDIVNNTITFNQGVGRGADGGIGLDFDRLQSPTNLEISGNTITLFDADAANADSTNVNGESGILFGVVIGPVTLRGRSNNVITLQGGGDIDTLFNLTPAQAQGSILVNGAVVP